MGKKDKGKKAKPLTGLAAALVKSGHLSEKKAKKIGREQRRDDKALGRDGVAQREQEKAAAAEAERAAQSVSDREREQSRIQGEAGERARRVIRTQGKTSGGGRRWFFVARDKRILFLDLADDVAGQLARGEAAIVESLGEHSAEHVILAAKDLGTLEGVDPGLIRFCFREPA